jgi:hypothetical protein
VRYMRRLALALAVIAAIAGYGMAGAHASAWRYQRADVRLCRYFPEFGATVRQAERSERAWSRDIRGTDPELRRFATTLARYVSAHPHARYTRGHWTAVYLACNPDA